MLRECWHIARFLTLIAFSMILIGGMQAFSALFMYWILFLFTNLGIFAMLWISRTKEQIWDKRYDHSYEKFSRACEAFPSSGCYY